MNQHYMQSYYSDGNYAYKVKNNLAAIRKKLASKDSCITYELLKSAIELNAEGY